MLAIVFMEDKTVKSVLCPFTPEEAEIYLHDQGFNGLFAGNYANKASKPYQEAYVVPMEQHSA